MKTKYKLLFILICILLFIFSACGNQALAPSNDKSQIDSSDKDGNTESKQIMTEEEIIATFTNLDSKAKDLLKWVQKNYTKIPLDGVPLHKVENVVVGLKVVSPDPEQPDVGGFAPVYGTAVFAKVTDETIPDFPWSSTEEITKAITDVFENVSSCYQLEFLASTDFNEPEGIFYQFDDGLYFRTSHMGYEEAEIDFGWDYSSMQVIKNGLDEITVTMWTKDVEHFFNPKERDLVRNEDGHWVLTTA